MTWHETHQRTRIIREVEAAAALDMSGALPWRSEWAAYFGSPAGLLAALRSRWDRMCEAQLDPRFGEDELVDTYGRLRRTQAGILEILRRAQDADGERLLALSGPAPAPTRRRRALRFHAGPVLP
jgi:hypothetical protein